MVVTPAILPKSKDELTEKLEQLAGLTARVQIDFCDGILGKEITWLPQDSDTLPSGFEYELDLMVKDWKTFYLWGIENGARRIIVHVDEFSPVDIIDLVAIAHDKGVTLGVAISNTKDVDFHATMLQNIEAHHRDVFIQVMGIDTIGIQGQPFASSVLERISRLHEQFPTLSIQVDGGMNNETAKMVKDSGADTAVVGSYLFKEGNPAETLASLKSLLA